MNKEKIRPLYSEVRGYLTQAPVEKDVGTVITEGSLWEQYNEALDLLNQLAGKDYSRFKIKPGPGYEGRGYTSVAVYRQKLSGLIATLHAEYFGDEPDPLGTSPGTVISQSQQQNQSVLIQMILDVQSKIDENMPKYVDGTKEKTFLQKVKGSLAKVSGVVELFGLLLKNASELGLDIRDIIKVLGL